MPLREEGAKEEGAVSQNPPFSSTGVVYKKSMIFNSFSAKTSIVLKLLPQ